ncbi:hypothetical protein EV641_109223 [Rhodococcus sp. SMB37]|uniref:hypothetical protein n=1 Tax=Rhodococcus sp. SMB37 TaxID=2512213 RepID=UPI001050C880|nr:hypothetical protein [Rhodococcus sp. SMB37]TCN51832.1 hypothetical protein EV641_109223 [Rhodococcus sp. SMB37]
MKTVEQVAALVAEALMPSSPEFVSPTATGVAYALLEKHAVVELPLSSYEDDQGISWDSIDTHPLALASGGWVWVHDDMLSPAQAEEWGAALLAAARAARTVRR